MEKYRSIRRLFEFAARTKTCDSASIGVKRAVNGRPYFQVIDELDIFSDDEFGLLVQRLLTSFPQECFYLRFELKHSYYEYEVSYDMFVALKEGVFALMIRWLKRKEWQREHASKG